MTEKKATAGGGPEAVQKPILEPVRLVSEDERLQHVVGASTFYYRRMPATVRNQLLHKATKRGNIDWGEFATLSLRWGLLGWSGVNDAAGHPVEYTDPKLADVLPGDVAVELQELMGAKSGDEAARLGN